ncbi:IS110 family transposase [Petrimonas sp.]|uniref:IS110 family transposase n=1 Tax=Petrimonas sp. TaxID=2023866 RepID=UPI002FCBFB26
MSIPEIGVLVSMCILTEVYDVNRFRNQREFAHYLGLIPTCYNSGDKKSNGEKTFRGNKQLGPMVVEASWKAIRSDIGLGMAFSSYLKRMKPQEAIIRIAKNYQIFFFRF